VIPLGDLAHGPLVEGFRHDEETHPVGQVEQPRIGRIVRGANGVHAHRLEQLEPSLPDSFGDGGAERARVVMQVHATHLDPAAVEQKAASRIVGDCSDPERCTRDIEDGAVGDDFGLELVQARRLHRPELRS
jgi:hypothetical protein